MNKNQLFIAMATCLLVVNPAQAIRRVRILSAQSDPSGRPIELEGSCQLEPSPRVMQLKIGHTHLVSVAGNATTTYAWRSLDPNVASVEADGAGSTARVTGKGIGETQVVAVAADGQGEARLSVHGISSRYTIVAWIDRTRIDPDSLAPNANDVLKKLLRFDCRLGTGFFYLGVPGLVTTEADRLYAKAYLVRATANDPPPRRLTEAFFRKPTAYKLWNDFQMDWRRTAVVTEAIVGKTPFPCDPRLPFQWDGEAHVDNGRVVWNPARSLLTQINEARIGKTAQEIERTIDPDGPGTPWIWSVLKFDKTGILGLDTQLFPTYSVYQDGVYCGTRRQVELARFVTGTTAPGVTQADVDRYEAKEWSEPCIE